MWSKDVTAAPARQPLGNPGGRAPGFRSNRRRSTFLDQRHQALRTARLRQVSMDAAKRRNLDRPPCSSGVT